MNADVRRNLLRLSRHWIRRVSLVATVGALCAGVFIGPSYASGPKLSLISHIDLPPRNLAIGSGGVRVAFASDTEIVLSWVEEDRTDATSQDSGRAATRLELIVERYMLRSGALIKTDTRRFSAVSVHDGVQVLPTGELLVNAEGKLQLLGQQEDSVEKSLNDVCQTEGSIQDPSFYAQLYPASESVGLLKLTWQLPIDRLSIDEKGQLHPPKPRMQMATLCWFDPHSLRSISSAYVKDSPGGSSSGLTLYSGPPGHVTSSTPEGSTPVIPPDCKSSGVGDWRQPYLLRSGLGVATACKDEIVLQDHDSSKSIKIPGGSALPIVLSDAWKAPVLVLVTGSITPALATGWQTNLRYLVVDFRSGQIWSVHAESRTNKSSVYVPTAPAAALSNDGSELAIEDGLKLTLYKLDPAP